MTARRHRVTGVLLGLLIVPGPARADYRETYRKAIEAVDRKRWTEVARLMREAIAENPKEGERVKLYGLRFEAYVPQFYLGLALLNTGDCEGAVRAFDAAEAAGAIRATPRYPEMLDGRKACASRLARTAPPAAPAPAATPSPSPQAGEAAAVAQAVQSAEEAKARAEWASRQVAILQADPLVGPSWSRDPDLGRAQGEATDLFSRAFGKLTAGRLASDLASLAAARDLYLKAADRLEAVRQAAASKREALVRAAAEGASPSPPPPDTPADLMLAARHYFNGNYEETVAALSRPPGRAGRATAQFYLLRAAANFALFRAGGEKEPALRERAVQEVVACHRADSSFRPDTLAFSPAFVYFFSNRGVGGDPRIQPPPPAAILKRSR